MRKTDVVVLAAMLCACLSACTQAEPPTTSEARDTTAAPPPPVTTPTPDPARDAVPADRGAEADPAAARQVVRDYYAAIDARDYATAYAMWSDGGAASGQSFEHFRNGYANTESVQATVGEALDEEGAAGSRYIQVPIELTARQRDGSGKRYRGRFTLRAVMADGASEEQRRWHLASADIQRIPD